MSDRKYYEFWGFWHLDRAWLNFKLGDQVGEDILGFLDGVFWLSSPKEDDILAILSLILATAPDSSGMVLVAVKGCLPGIETVPGGGGIDAGIVSCQAGAHGNLPALAD